MKAILEFELPGDQEDFDMAQNGWKYLSVLREFDTWLRARLKHEELDGYERETYETIRDELYKCVDGQGVNVWD